MEPSRVTPPFYIEKVAIEFYQMSRDTCPHICWLLIAFNVSSFASTLIPTLERPDVDGSVVRVKCNGKLLFSQYASRVVSAHD